MVRKTKLKIKNVNITHKESLSVTDKIALWITNNVGTFGFLCLLCCLLFH